MCAKISRTRYAPRYVPGAVRYAVICQLLPTSAESTLVSPTRYYRQALLVDTFVACVPGTTAVGTRCCETLC